MIEKIWKDARNRIIQLMKSAKDEESFERAMKSLIRASLDSYIENGSIGKDGN